MSVRSSGWARQLRFRSSAAGLGCLLGCLIVAGGLTSCSSTGNSSSNTPDGGESHGATSATQKKLQGKWEIVRYESLEPIKPDVMPIFAAMFDEMRLEVQDESLLYEGKSFPFQAEDESGDSFRLHSKSGMFDNAECRFTGDDEFEVDDKGPTWPGKTILHRTQ